MANKDVQDEIDHMSERLYIEHYGNIMIFVCHFANNEKVIESVLLDAYGTLEHYDVLDVSKSNALIQEIAAAVDAIVPKMIVDNGGVSDNKDRALTRLDEAGINVGQVFEVPDEIDENIDTVQEEDFAAISASFKIMDVLGQILQNYPGNIDGKLKVSIIDELSKLGLRSVQAIIKTMGYLEHDLAEFIYARLVQEKKVVSKDMIILATKKFINTLISGMVRAMINKIAVSLNSPIILPAVSEALKGQDTIASELVLVELKVNCLKKVNYHEIEKLSKKYVEENEHFANSILSSIMASYLNMNKCDYQLRAKICSLFGFSQKEMLKNNQSLLTERGYQ